MKSLRSILIAIAVITSVTMLSCKETKTESETTAEMQGKEYTSAYVCPMHCENSGSDKEGTCDTCGMTLVKNEAHKADGHTHE